MTDARKQHATSTRSLSFSDCRISVRGLSKCLIQISFPESAGHRLTIRSILASKARGSGHAYHNGDSALKGPHRRARNLWSQKAEEMRTIYTGGAPAPSEDALQMSRGWITNASHCYMGHRHFRTSYGHVHALLYIRPAGISQTHGDRSSRF